MDTLRQMGDRGPWAQTQSGRAFYIGDPRPDEVHLEDVAYSLARQTRYNGHHNGELYSVGQHAVLVSVILEDMYPCEWALAYEGLHHDDAETYTGDIITQIKHLCPELRELLKPVEAACAEAFGCTYPHPPEIKAADLVALATEKRDVMPAKHQWIPEQWRPLPPAAAKPIPTMTATKAADAYLRRHAFLLRKYDAESGRWAA